LHLYFIGWLLHPRPQQGLPHRGAISSSLLMGATPRVLHLIFATLVGMMAVELIYNGFAGRI
jgi:hypothetical protein